MTCFPPAWRSHARLEAYFDAQLCTSANARAQQEGAEAGAHIKLIPGSYGRLWPMSETEDGTKLFA